MATTADTESSAGTTGDPVTVDADRFTTSELSRALYKETHQLAWERLTEDFLMFSETEPNARQAAALVANIYVRHVAQFAVFAARSMGLEPNPDLWLRLCTEKMEQALADVDQAAVDSVVAHWIVKFDDHQSAAASSEAVSVADGQQS